MQSLAASSALGLRSALALAVARLLKAREEAAAAAQAAAIQETPGVVTEAVAGDRDGDGETAAPGVGGEEEESAAAGRSEVSSRAAVASAVAAVADAQEARLGVLAGLVAAVSDKVCIIFGEERTGDGGAGYVRGIRWYLPLAHS